MNEILEVVKERDIHVVLSENAKEFLADKGYDPLYGARQVRRTIRKYIEDPIAEELLKGRFHDGSHILVKRNKEKLVFLEMEKTKKEGKQLRKPKEVNPQKSA